MMILRFRTNSEHEDILNKVKKMKRFAEDLEECLEDMTEEDAEYRSTDYRKDWDDEGREMRGSRYDYRRNSRR